MRIARSTTDCSMEAEFDHEMRRKKCKVQSGHGDVDRPPLWEMDSSSTVEFEYDIEIVMVTRLDRRFLKTRSSVHAKY